MKNEISIYKIIFIFLILFQKYSIASSVRANFYKINNPTFKNENIIKKQLLIKLNADISNFGCHENYSYEKLNQIGVTLNKLLILSAINKKKTNLDALHKKWVDLINNCVYLSKVNFIDEQFNNFLSQLSNENYPKYLEVILKIYEQTSKIKKQEYNFGYENNYCTANFRLGYSATAEKCFEKLLSSEEFNSLTDTDQIKLKIIFEEVILEKNDCKINSEIKNIQEVKSVDDVIALTKEIKSSICSLDFEYANKKIEQLQKLNKDQILNFDFEYEVFFYQFSYSIKKKDFKFAQEILTKKLIANQNNIRELNFYIYLQALLYYSAQNYESAKNEILKIMSYEQFSPIFKYRVNLIGCMMAPLFPAELKSLCKVISNSEGLDEKYILFANMIKSFHSNNSLDTLNKVKAELQKRPGSIELFF